MHLNVWRRRWRCHAGRCQAARSVAVACSNSSSLLRLRMAFHQRTFWALSRIHTRKPTTPTSNSHTEYIRIEKHTKSTYLMIINTWGRHLGIPSRNLLSLPNINRILDTLFHGQPSVQCTIIFKFHGVALVILGYFDIVPE